MEAKILKKENNKVEIEIDNLTIAELLRNALWEDKDVRIAAWRREHPSKNPVLILETKNKEPLKVLERTIDKIKENNKKITSEFKRQFK